MTAIGGCDQLVDHLRRRNAFSGERNTQPLAQLGQTGGRRHRASIQAVEKFRGMGMRPGQGGGHIVHGSPLSKRH